MPNRFTDPALRDIQRFLKADATITPGAFYRMNQAIERLDRAVQQGRTAEEKKDAEIARLVAILDSYGIDPVTGDTAPGEADRTADDGLGGHPVGDLHRADSPAASAGVAAGSTVVARPVGRGRK